MTDPPHGYAIEEFVFEDLGANDQIAFLDLFNLASSEREPRHSAFSKDELIGVLNFPGDIRNRFLVRDPSRRPVAHASAAHPDDGSNPDRLKVAISVHPSHRRIGIGSALLSTVVAVAKELSRPTMTGIIFDTVPAGAGFLDAIGGERTIEHQSNVLPLAELSRELMRGWVDEGPSRAPGYSVELFDGTYPDHILDQMAHLYVILERDMPTSEGHQPRSWTSSQVVEFMDGFLKTGDMLTAVAFVEDSNEAVGMSQLYRRRRDPRTWFVTTTMVDPSHRGHALGKWLKGAVNLAALELWPGGEFTETGNAETNNAMLDINRTMGFRTELTLSEVAASVESAEEYLASRA